jgi:hypothetical protein
VPGRAIPLGAVRRSWPANALKAFAAAADDGSTEGVSGGPAPRVRRPTGGELWQRFRCAGVGVRDPVS